MPDSLTGKEGEEKKREERKIGQEIAMKTEFKQGQSKAPERRWESGGGVSRLTSHRAGEKSNLVEISGAIFPAFLCLTAPQRYRRLTETS